MTRKKVKLAFIANESSRKATFKKRKKGLIKKVNELSTLCGINACAVIYSPYDSNPEVWPSNSGVQRIVADFRELPEMDQNKKMVDQESFLRQRISKASENLKKQRKENRELEMTQVMFQCLLGNMGMFHMNILDLNDLGYLVDQYLKNVNRRIEILRNSGMEIGESSDVVAAASEGIETMSIVVATTSSPATITEMASSSSDAVATTHFNPFQQQQQQQLFHHPSTLHLELYEQSRNRNQNQNQQQWFMGMMNRSEQMSLPFTDDNRHQSQEQQITSESPAVLIASSSSSIMPVTNPNLTNNIWFR